MIGAGMELAGILQGKSKKAKGPRLGTLAMEEPQINQQFSYFFTTWEVISPAGSS